MAQAIASSPLARTAYAAVAPYIAPIGTYLEASQRADTAWASIAETRANFDPSNPEHVQKMEAHKQQWEGAYNDKIKTRTPYELAKIKATGALQDVLRVKPEDGLHVMAHDFTSKSLHRDILSRDGILSGGDGSEGNKAIREQVVKSGEAASQFALDWLEKHVDSRGRTLATEIGYSSDGRAFARRATGAAIVPVVALGYHLDLNNAKQSAVHEFGHFLEDNIEDIGNRARAFLRYRVGSEKRTDIGTVPGGEGMKGEMGRKDQFHRAFPDLPSAYYCGKSYDHGATEITAMGLEKLHSDPVGFFATDPEYAAFIVTLLRPPHDDKQKG